MSDTAPIESVLVLYDYTATKASKLSIKAGEILTVLDSKGKWLVGRNLDGKQ
jgi:hypothetical protein